MNQHCDHLVGALGGHLVKESAQLLLLLVFDTAVHNLNKKNRIVIVVN